MFTGDPEDYTLEVDNAATKKLRAKMRAAANGDT